MLANSSYMRAVELKIDPELKKFLPLLTDEEFGQLEKNMLAHPNRRVVLLVWVEKDVLLDGHNRYAVCRKHGFPYEIDYISLSDMDAAHLWMVNEHLGRRNFTDEQKSYWRGKQYEWGKQKHGGDRASGQNAHLKTSQQIAKQHHVDESTIRRNAKFAQNVDAIASAAGDDAKDAILRGDVKITRQEVQKVAEIAKAQPQAAKNVLREIKTAAKPQQVKQIVQEASRQLQKAEPKPKPTSGTLFPIAKPEKTIEEVQLRGGTGYIVRDPKVESVFNQTNDMVDWASYTWNPVTGCWHGCDYCYARAIANDERMASIYPHKFEPTFHEARLKAPANTAFPKVINRPADRNVFVCSMADLFGKWVPDEWIVRVFEQVKLCSRWNYLFLTKFPQRLRSVCDNLKGFPDNAWVGCTVDSQARVKTAEEAFKGLRAKVRWLSVEPMQERLTFGDLSMFDWLVVGGKSASSFNGTPESQPEWEWVEHLFQQARAAKLKIYFKENLKVKPKEVPWAAGRK
jgi:protein gp37